MPIDIARQYPVVRLSLQGLFPTMDCDVLSELPGLDFDHLAFIADQLPLQKMDKQEADIVPFFPDRLVVPVADILGHFFIQLAL